MQFNLNPTDCSEIVLLSLSVKKEDRTYSSRGEKKKSHLRFPAYNSAIVLHAPSSPPAVKRAESSLRHMFKEFSILDT